MAKNTKLRPDRKAIREHAAAHPHYLPEVGMRLVLNGKNSETLFGGHSNGDEATVVELRGGFWVELKFDDGTDGGTSKDLLGYDVTYWHFNKT